MNGQAKFSMPRRCNRSLWSVPVCPNGPLVMESIFSKWPIPHTWPSPCSPAYHFGLTPPVDMMLRSRSCVQMSSFERLTGSCRKFTCDIRSGRRARACTIRLMTAHLVSALLVVKKRRTRKSDWLSVRGSSCKHEQAGSCARLSWASCGQEYASTSPHSGGLCAMLHL